MHCRYVSSQPDTNEIAVSLNILQGLSIEFGSRVSQFLEEVESPADLVTITGSTDQSGRMVLSVRPSDRLTAFIGKLIW